MAYARVQQSGAAGTARTAMVARRTERLARPTPGITARPQVGMVYRTPIYGYTGLAGYNAGGARGAQTYQDALGFNLFKAIGKVVTAPVKAVKAVGKVAVKGVTAGAKFVAKHPLEVAAVAVGAPLAFVGAKAAINALSKPKAPTPSVAPILTPTVIAEPATAPQTIREAIETGTPTPVPALRPSVAPMLAPSLAEAVQASLTQTGTTATPARVAQSAAEQLQTTVQAAANVPPVTGPTWTDALKSTVAQVGKDTLATFKRKAINTVLAQPGVRKVATEVAGEVVSAQAGEAAAALPSWLLPVGIGVGALMVGTMLGGRSQGRRAR